jgi:hypothetical protein
MSEDDQNYQSGAGLAVERGPNYDWKHEAEYYRQECDRLRELIYQMEISGDKIFEENYRLRKALAIAKDGLSTAWREYDQEYSPLTKIEETLNKIEKLENS